MVESVSVWVKVTIGVSLSVTKFVMSSAVYVTVSATVSVTSNVATPFPFAYAPLAGLIPDVRLLAVNITRASETGLLYGYMSVTVIVEYDVPSAGT
jgi:hypothetical protein